MNSNHTNKTNVCKVHNFITWVKEQIVLVKYDSNTSKSSLVKYYASETKQSICFKKYEYTDADSATLCLYIKHFVC